MSPFPQSPFAMSSARLDRSRLLRRLAAIALITAGLIQARPAAAQSAETLTLYSAQHEQVVQMLTDAFTKETGIAVRVHSGEGPDIANQILREGKSSPADIVFVENSPELVLLAEHGLLAPVAPTTLAKVPQQDSGASGLWLGVLARQNVLAWNPSLIREGELPSSLLDLALPAWKGRVAIAPSDADFLPLVGAVIHAEGEAKALAWLKGLRANAKIYDDDEGVVAAVNRGSVATGVINNYYWARLATELGADRMHSRIAHFAPGDIGNLINISGAAMLASSRHQEAAQRFLAFLVSKPVQEMLAKSSVDYEYPLAADVAPNAMLTPYADLHPPAIAPAELGDDQASAKLLQEAGLI
ncbi:MAG TPA: iron ABC transporter substrate-binding protein [Acetobacteraceae bacterium]|nr:iron ABC transporter substrate-binding protein [Acetobacteraceae bacterium]